MSAITIDPNILRPTGEIGRAESPPEFFDVVIGAINDHADIITTEVGVTAETIDTDILKPQGEIGKATNTPEFYDAVIAAINDHADLIDNFIDHGFSFQDTPHVVILGDSNAYGNGDTDNLDDRDLVDTFANARITQVLGSGVPFTEEYNVPDSPLAPFAAGGVAGMGIELALGRALYAAGRTPVRISKWASRGSSMDRWILGGSYNSQVIAFLDAQVALYGEIGTVYLDLGTNDASDRTLSNSWEKNCHSLITQLRDRYGNFLLIVRNTSQGLDPAYPYFQTVRAQEFAFVTNDALSKILGSEGIPLAPDLLHFTANNYSLFGYRVSAEIVSALGPAIPPPGPIPTYIGCGGGVSGASTLQPISFPAPGYDGTYFEILVVATGLTNGAGKATLSDAAGFVEIGSQKSTTGGLDEWITIFYRRCTSRYMAAPTVADNNQYNAAKIFTFRQPTTSSGSPLDTTATSSGAIFSKNDTYDPAISVAGGTPGVANTLFAIFGANYGGSPRTASGWANAALDDFTVRAFSDQAIGGEHEVIFCVTGEKAVAGAVGATTATANLQLLGAYCTLVIKP